MKTDLRELWSQNLSTLAFSKAGFCVCHAQRSKGFTQYELTDVPTSARTAPTAGLFSGDFPSRHCEERQQRSNLSAITNSCHPEFPVCHSEHSEESSKSEPSGGPPSARTAPTLAILSRWGLETVGVEVQFRHCEERQQRSNLSSITNSPYSELPVCHAEYSEASKQCELGGGPGFTRTAPTLDLHSGESPRRHCGERQQRSNLVLVLEGSGSPTLCCSLAHVQFPVVKPAQTVLITRFPPQVAR
jgi:hypothetical protein